jgi:hypothetical protein
MTDRGSMLLKSRASPDMLFLSLCNKKRIAILHMNRVPVLRDAISVEGETIGSNIKIIFMCQMYVPRCYRRIIEK